MHSLLENISHLTRLLQQPVSYETLSTLTPVSASGNLDYRVLGEVLTHQGFENHLQRRALKSINKLTLPAVLLMRDNQAVILKSLDGQQATIEVAGTGPQLMSLEDLDKDFIGYVWFIKQKASADVRSELPEYRLGKGWFWRVIWRFRRYYFQIILATLIINTLALVSSLYVMNVYDRVVPNKTYETLWVLSIGVFIAIFFEFIAKVIRGRLTDIAGKKADLIISAALFRRVLQIQMKNKPASAGSYANNLRDFESVREFMTSASLLAMVDIPFFLLFIAVMNLVAGKLAIVPMSIIPMVIVIGIFAQFPLSRSINESMRESSQRQGLAVEAVSGIETLKAHNAYSWAQKRWNYYTAKSAASSMKTKDLSSLVTSLSAMLQQLNTVVLVVYGTYLIHAEEPSQRITMGALIACVILSGRALAPVGQIAGLAVRFQSARLALRSVNEIAERPIEYDIDRKYITLDNPQGAMAFSNCNFGYDESGKKALDGISLNIQAGEKVAILGRIGSGKSTLLKLASGLYEQQEGMVSLDGVDVRQIDPYYLRNQIALLSQNPNLFLGTLRDNLDMARNDGFFSDDELLAALNRFGMAQLIQQHPKGLDMPIGEGGAGLSGGQKQIVALAQLTLKDPTVVLLDEPTSNLDQNSENVVLSALNTWLRQRTLILVTHRPQLLALVDRIVVVEQGKVVMDGPKQQVLAQLSGQQPAPQAQQPASAQRPVQQSAPQPASQSVPVQRPVQQPAPAQRPVQQVQQPVQKVQQPIPRVQPAPAPQIQVKTATVQQPAVTPQAAATESESKPQVQVQTVRKVSASAESSAPTENPAPAKSQASIKVAPNIQVQAQRSAQPHITVQPTIKVQPNVTAVPKRVQPAPAKASEKPADAPEVAESETSASPQSSPTQANETHAIGKVKKVPMPAVSYHFGKHKGHSADAAKARLMQVTMGKKVGDSDSVEAVHQHLDSAVQANAEPVADTAATANSTADDTEEVVEETSTYKILKRSE